MRRGEKQLKDSAGLTRIQGEHGGVARTLTSSPCVRSIGCCRVRSRNSGGFSLLLDEVLRLRVRFFFFFWWGEEGGFGGGEWELTTLKSSLSVFVHVANHNEFKDFS